jgi:hypothetical protein
MNFALIPPTRMQDFWPFKQNYHLLLAHECTRDTKRPEGYVILDNGAYEGVHTLFANVINTAERLQPDILVLPDVLGSYTDTVYQCKEAAQQLSTPTIQNALRDTRFMIVPHGGRPTTWIECLDDLLKVAPIRTNTVGIPVMYEEEFSTRVELVYKVREYCRDQGCYLDIHLLGWDGQVGKVYTYSALADDPWAPIIGIDSAKPIYWALYGRNILQGLQYSPSRPSDYFSLQELDFGSLELLEFNVRLIQAVSVSGKYARPPVE